MGNLQREWISDLPTQRLQENVSKKSSDLEKKISDTGTIVFETEKTDNSTAEAVKSYATGEFEIFHGLNKEISSLFASPIDGMAIVNLLTTNPDNKDRKQYFRVNIVSVKISGSNIVTDSVSKKIKFMVA